MKQPYSTAQVMLRAWAFVLIIGALQGCANLTAVREFGKSAAEVTSYVDAGNAYQDSARTIQPYLTNAPARADVPDARKKQVAAANALQSTLVGYFSTLAQLAGEDSFTLDKELNAIALGLKSLPDGTLDTGTTEGAIALTKIAQRLVLSRAQSSAIKELVNEGGPTATRLLSRLELVAKSWRGMLENDSRTVGDALFALSSARDTSPLVRMLARDRMQEYEQRYEDFIKRVDTATAALGKIRSAHAAMAEDLDSLDRKELQAVLKDTVTDLKAARKNLDALR
ncbi:hypothetical protein [Acidovorax sp. SUPP2539]|uniref:hypothetical protein n=1 Tax=Acidovorax sp. SUPP2539 TaxID=2920878 RepID=UPI0023DE5D72|nr:hypothetical protein [Acidovorax sp. SUPP2539]GKS90139.1 hypothetical protein AVTE2539_12260 [Acidovorax sp. SUPP2539]